MWVVRLDVDRRGINAECVERYDDPVDHLPGAAEEAAVGLSFDRRGIFDPYRPLDALDLIGCLCL